MDHSPSQRGSAIIMLFIAVALFGMLAYAFTRGTGSSTSLITDEQAKVYAQQIIAYGNDIKTAVKRLQLRGVPENYIDFNNSVYNKTDGTPTTSNNSTTTDPANEVFSPQGGGLRPFIVPLGAIDVSAIDPDQISAGHMYFRSAEIMGTKSSANDVVMILPRVKKKVCQKIHQLLNMQEDIPADSNVGWESQYWTFGGTAVIGDNEPAYIGKKAFCAGTGTARTMWWVLIDR